MKITLTELRNTHPVTTASLIEALEDFIEVDCDCTECNEEVTSE